MNPKHCQWFWWWWWCCDSASLTSSDLAVRTVSSAPFTLPACAEDNITIKVPVRRIKPANPDQAGESGSS